MDLELIAKVAHNVNNAYNAARGESTLPEWENLSEELKQSGFKGVQYRLDNLEATPEDQHNAWQESKIADGWVYGEVKDMDKKTHPCLVPYNELPLEQRVKDYLFVGVVKSFV